MGERTGQFCELDHFQDFEIAPYGRFVLGQGNDTVSLIQCDGVAVQLICDRHATRLDVGATLPANGHQRYLRNPYSKTIRGKILQGHSPNFVRPSNEDDPCFKVFHQTLVSIDQYKTPDFQYGLFILPARSNFKAHIRGNTQTTVSLIPEAKLSHVDLAPPQIVFSDRRAIEASGDKNEYYHCKFMKYEPNDVIDWATLAGWKSRPIEVATGETSVQVNVPRGTSLLVHTSWKNQVLRATVNITDLGDWHPEWLGTSDA